MAIKRIGIITPPPDTQVEIGTVETNGLADLVATNLDEFFVYVDAWVEPDGATSPSQFYTIFYDIIVPKNESLNSHKFTINENDKVYVKSSGNTSFIMNAIQEGTMIR